MDLWGFFMLALNMDLNLITHLRHDFLQLKTSIKQHAMPTFQHKRKGGAQPFDYGEENRSKLLLSAVKQPTHGPLNNLMVRVHAQSELSASLGPRKH